MAEEGSGFQRGQVSAAGLCLSLWAPRAELSTLQKGWIKRGKGPPLPVTGHWEQETVPTAGLGVTKGAGAWQRWLLRTSDPKHIPYSICRACGQHKPHSLRMAGGQLPPLRVCSTVTARARSLFSRRDSSGPQPCVPVPSTAVCALSDRKH